MEFDALFKGLPLFFAYLALGLVLLFVYCMIYMWVTPHDELRLIRSGNTAAVLSLGGAVLGFILPLGMVIAHNAKIGNVVLWGVIAMVVQVLAFFLARAILPGMPKAIEDGKISVGACSGLVSLTIGILNAACQTD